MTSDAPRLAIVVPSIEPLDILTRHLRDLRDRTKGNCELIVVGAAHGLQTSDLVDRFGFHSGRVISGRDRSHPHAINLGLTSASARALVWMNTDDLPCPALLDAAALCADSQTFVYGDATRHAPGSVMSPYGVPPRVELDTMRTWCPIAQPACVIPVSALARIGLLDAGFNLAFDYDYWIRALQAGMIFQRVDAVLADVAIRPEAKSFKNRASVFAEEAEIQRRHFGRVQPKIYEAYWSECESPAFDFETIKSELLDHSVAFFQAERQKSADADRLIESDARLRFLAQGLRVNVTPDARLTGGGRISAGREVQGVTLWVGADSSDVALLTDDGDFIEGQAAGAGFTRLTWRPSRTSHVNGAQIFVSEGSAVLTAAVVQWSEARLARRDN